MASLVLFSVILISLNFNYGCVCVFVLVHRRVVLIEARNRHWMTSSEVTGCCPRSTQMWVLEVELLPSGRAADALNCWASLQLLLQFWHRTTKKLPKLALSLDCTSGRPWFVIPPVATWVARVIDLSHQGLVWLHLYLRALKTKGTSFVL